VLCEGDSDTLVLTIELGVELAHEDVSENPDRSTRGRHIQMHHTGDAFLTHFGVVDLDDIVFVGERVSLTFDNVCNLRERRSIRAITVGVDLLQDL